MRKCTYHRVHTINAELGLMGEQVTEAIHTCMPISNNLYRMYGCMAKCSDQNASCNIASSKCVSDSTLNALN